MLVPNPVLKYRQGILSYIDFINTLHGSRTDMGLIDYLGRHSFGSKYKWDLYFKIVKHNVSMYTIIL